MGPTSRSLRFKIGIFALISLLGVSFVGVQYLRWFDTSYPIYLEASQTGGAYTHAAVAYRGVPIGTVGDIEVKGDGARMELLIESDVKIPRDVKAAVAQRSAVGEQYVDLRPKKDKGPYLKTGEVLKGAETPKPMQKILANLDKMLDSVDPEDAEIVIDELGAAFEGNEDALARMLDATETLVDDASEHLPQTVDLLRDGHTVLDTQLDSAGAIRTWADKLEKLTSTVVDSDDDIRELMEVGPEAADEVSQLVDGVDPNLGAMLGDMIAVNGAAVRRLPNVEALLVTYPMTVTGGFTVTPGDGTAHFGLALNFDNPPPCIYQDGTKSECTEEELSGGSSVRGWQNAPDPTGPPVKPAPLPGSDGDNNSDASEDTGPSEFGDEKGDNGSDEASFGYDPLTGMLVDGDGKPVQFADTSAQADLAGEESWKYLLLTGVT